ncbi:MAG: galactose mutarotase [Erysipelotrichaceae bacterium]|nr:galactose mutarotase [Erysipelotrichaceae bacterium]
MICRIENEKLIAKVSTLGATLVSLVEKESGIDIVLGYDDEKGYLLHSGDHIGATVGRNANRIAKGQFRIGEETYQLSINNGPNNLHSGVSDFSFRAFDVKEVKDDSITLSITDNDMSGGFPGNLKLDVTYKLEGNDLLFRFDGICDRDSILNVTSHSYFNLNGADENICNHELKLYAGRVSLNDDDGMATDKVIDVTGTAFDFTDFTVIGDNFRKGHENFSNGGIDHNYVFENMEDKEIAVLRNDRLELEVRSDLPCVHVYTSNFIDRFTGKYGKEYRKYWGICLECDYYANGINYEGFIKPIIKANEEVSHYIRYTVRKR